jgi:hypothetical protein
MSDAALFPPFRVPLAARLCTRRLLRRVCSSVPLLLSLQSAACTPVACRIRGLGTRLPDAG